MRHPSLPSDAHETALRAHFGSLDLGGVSEIGDVERQTIVCFTNRSGSTYLCSLLQQLGLMGFGRFEPFNKEGAIADSEALGIRTFRDYYRHLLATTASTKGNFAAKASFSQLNMLINSRLFTYGNRRPRLIFISRRNIIAQACSHVFALQTGAWTSNHAPRQDSTPVYDREQILSAAAAIAHANAMFELLFSYYDFDVLRIVYEDLALDPDRHRALLRREFDLGDEPLIELRRQIARQAEPTKAAWEARVREHHDFTP